LSRDGCRRSRGNRCRDRRRLLQAHPARGAGARRLKAPRRRFPRRRSRDRGRRGRRDEDRPAFRLDARWARQRRQSLRLWTAISERGDGPNARDEKKPAEEQSYHLHAISSARREFDSPLLRWNRGRSSTD
jgi:hypothetical protein